MGNCETMQAHTLRLLGSREGGEFWRHNPQWALILTGTTPVIAKSLIYVHKGNTILCVASFTTVLVMNMSTVFVQQKDWMPRMRN